MSPWQRGGEQVSGGVVRQSGETTDKKVAVRN